jgi:hypothetical protein
MSSIESSIADKKLLLSWPDGEMTITVEVGDDADNDQQVTLDNASFLNAFFTAHYRLGGAASLTRLVKELANILDGKTADIEYFIPGAFNYLEREKNYYYRVPIKRACELTVLARVLFVLQRMPFWQSSWLLVDLPPGVGKTFEIEKCSRRNLLGKMCISTPTAKTRRLYTHGQTIHANFNIDPQDNQFKTENVRFDVAGRDTFVFDEVSMCGLFLLVQILKYLKCENKWCLLIGDTCQMPPVMQKQINFYNPEPVFSENFGNRFGFLAVPSADIEIYRMREDPQLRSFTLFLRDLILKDFQKKKRGALLPRNKSTCQALVDALSQFCIVEKKLEFDNTLWNMVQRQNEVLDVCKELLAEFKSPRLDSLNELFADRIKRACQYRPLCVGYENEFNIQILEQILERSNMQTLFPGNNVQLRTPLDFDDDLAAENIAKRQKTVPQEWSSVFVDVRMFPPNILTLLRKNAHDHLLNADNVLRTGMIIRCRENTTTGSGKFFNGQLGVFLKFVVVEPNLFASICVNSLDPLSSGAKNTATVFNYQVPQAVAPPNVGMFKSSVQMLIIDFQTEKLRLVEPAFRLFCAHCKSAKQKCMFHQNHASCDQGYFYFNWVPSYSFTIFNLQGSTIASEEKLVLIPEKIFFRHMLRTLYIIISRCQTSKQIIIDKSFVIHCLKFFFHFKNNNDVQKYIDTENISLFSNSLIKDMF